MKNKKYIFSEELIIRLIEDVGMPNIIVSGLVGISTGALTSAVCLIMLKNNGGNK